MFRRIAKVQSVNVQSVDLSSLLQIGDSMEIIGRSRILAIQREQELFFGNEGNLDQYSIFNRTIHLPQITEPLYEKKENIKNCIHVNHLSVIGAAGSAIIHIGNNDSIFMESKTKHIRQNSEFQLKEDSTS